MLHVANPELGFLEKKYIEECMSTNWISSKGRFVKLFEEEFARVVDAKHAIAVTNGTAALHLALTTLSIGPGDYVIVPDYTFAATLNAVLMTGATPIIVDVDPDTWAIDVEQVRKIFSFIPESQIKAILPVAISGYAWNIEELDRIAAETRTPIIGDLAQALGSRIIEDREETQYQLDNCVDIAAYSLFANKVITTGEGGMVTTDDDDVEIIIRTLRNQGMRPGTEDEITFTPTTLGYNYRMTNLQAAIGLGQLDQLQDILAAKLKITMAYAADLSHFEELRFQKREENNIPSYWMFRVQTDFDPTPLRKALLDAGIETKPLYPPLHTLNYSPNSILFKEYPVATNIKGFYLPTHSGVTNDDLITITQTFEQHCGIGSDIKEARNNN
jgi:perosamine synthetase